jgi:hypothetical protein
METPTHCRIRACFPESRAANRSQFRRERRAKTASHLIFRCKRLLQSDWQRLIWNHEARECLPGIDSRVGRAELPSNQVGKRFA